MTDAVELIEYYRKLSKPERLHFLRSLALFLDLDLPDNVYPLRIAHQALATPCGTKYSSGFP